MAYNKTIYPCRWLNTYYKGSADMPSVLSLFNMVSFVCGPPCIYILFSNQLTLLEWELHFDLLVPLMHF